MNLRLLIGFTLLTASSIGATRTLKAFSVGGLVKKTTSMLGYDEKYYMLQDLATNGFQNLKQYLDEGLDPNAIVSSKDGKAPLIVFTVCENNLAATRELLKRGAQPDEHFCHGGFSLLTEAIGQGNIEMVQLLLDYGAHPLQSRKNYRNKDVTQSPDSPLICALRLRKYPQTQDIGFQIMELLLNTAKKQNPTHLYTDELSGALSFATNNADFAAMELLFKHGADCKYLLVDILTYKLKNLISYFETADYINKNKASAPVNAITDILTDERSCHAVLIILKHNFGDSDLVINEMYETYMNTYNHMISLLETLQKQHQA